MAYDTSIPVTKDEAKKHYYHSGVTATVRATAPISSTIENYNKIALSLGIIRYDASGKKIGSNRYNGTKVNSPMPSGSSFTASESGQYEYRVTASAYQINDNNWVYVDTENLTGTASYTYGSKATPTASCSITGGFVDRSTDQTFKFSADAIDYIDEQYSIASGTLYYKLSTAGSYTSTTLTDGTAVLPANTFAAEETYDFYAVLVMDDGTSITTPVTQINTIEPAPTATALSPSNRVMYGAVLFDWDYSIATGTDQYAFDLQISSDQSVWADVASHEVSTATEKTASVSLAGTVYWRVRVYNSGDTASSWSSVLSFVNNVPPDPPQISSISGTGRISVNWNAPDQIAYQVVVGDYDSGWVYSTDKSHFINDYLVNGSYTVKVRITSGNGFVSDWAAVTYTQSISSPAPTAVVEMFEGCNRITIDAGSFDTFYILRNGEVIAQTTAGVYEDFFCNGADEYIVRGVNADDTFADLPLTGAYTCRKPAVITPDGDIVYVNERLDEQPDISASEVLDVVSVGYLGRAKPVHHVGRLLTRMWTVACAQRLELGKIYFYRNFRGDKSWVICKSIQSSLNWFGVHEYQFTLEETDYKEGIGYELQS